MGEFEVPKKPSDALSSADCKGREIENIPDQTANDLLEILDFSQKKNRIATLIAEKLGILLTPLQREVIERQLELFGKRSDTYSNIAIELNEDPLFPRKRLFTSLDIENAEAEATAILRDNYHHALRLKNVEDTLEEIRKITPANAKPYLM